MDDERPKVRRYRNPSYRPDDGDMTLWDALRDHADYAETDPAATHGHRFSSGEIREVLDTIAQLRWDLGTAQRELAIAQARGGVQRGAKEIAEGAAMATMAALEKAKRERDEARDGLKQAVAYADDCERDADRMLALLAVIHGVGPTTRCSCRSESIVSCCDR